MMIMNVKELKKYKILVKSDAGECNLYAAENLQKYLKLTTKVNLKIVTDDKAVSFPFFSIGETKEFLKANKDFDRTTLIHDGFRIFKDENNNIYFDSLSPRGVMYAVFDFLEVELGVRFLTVNAEHVPTVKEVNFDKIPRVSIPSFELGSEIFTEIFGQGRNPKTDFDLFAKMRARDLFTSPNIPAKFGGPFPYCARNDFHNYHYYCPAKDHGEKHPEWYKYITVNGVRHEQIDLTNGITLDGKVDESMEESVLKTVIEEFKKDMDANPNAEIFGFTQEDSADEVDNEANRMYTEKYGRSGIMVRFCNAIIRELNKYAKEKYNKTVKLITFAYGNTKYAPMKEVDGERVPIDDTVICDENLIIMYAIAGNMYFPYGDPRQSKSNLQIISDWKKLANRFWFWGYDNNYAHFQCYMDTFHTINDNMKFFKELGVEYLFMEAGGGKANWQIHMRAYAYLKKIWNVDLDANELLKEYANLYYGPVGDRVLEIIDLFHNYYKTRNEGTKEEDQVFFWMRQNIEKASSTPIELLERVLAITYEMDQTVDNSKLSKKEKKVLKQRISEVRMTPAKMICHNFYDYYPSATKEERIKACDLYVESARGTGYPDEELFSGSRWRIVDQYIPEIYEKHEKYERGEREQTNSKQMIPNDVI